MLYAACLFNAESFYCYHSFPFLCSTSDLAKPGCISMYFLLIIVVKTEYVNNEEMRTERERERVTFLALSLELLAL